MKYEEVYTPAIVIKMQADGDDPPAKDRFTCNGCIDVDKCEFAWDPYNTDGECLELK